jgi:hypothetical protein
LKIVDSEMATGFFNRTNVAGSCTPLFGDQLKSSEVVKRRSVKHGILNHSHSGTELNEGLQIGACFTTEAQAILGALAKRDMNVSKSSPKDARVSRPGVSGPKRESIMMKHTKDFASGAFYGQTPARAAAASSQSPWGVRVVLDKSQA